MLNENIKRIRKSKGLSQEELAIKLNVVRQTVSKWENGLSVPDSSMLIILANELDTTVSELLGEPVAEPTTDDLKILSEKLEVINLQLAKRSMTRKYYRDIEDVGTDNDIVMVSMDDPSNSPKEIFVTSIVFEAESDLGENSPSEPVISQYPLEDILDKFYVYLHDDYVDENTSDTINSYVEFASEDIEDIRAVLSILGKHVYNVDEGDYIDIKIEPV